MTCSLVPRTIEACMATPQGPRRSCAAAWVPKCQQPGPNPGPLKGNQTSWKLPMDVRAPLSWYPKGNQQQTLAVSGEVLAAT